MTLDTHEILISPYGGQLVDLIVSEEEREELRASASKLVRLQLTARSLCDFELLATGGFSPLKTFMNRLDYERVVGEMRLSEGTLFPIPITLNFNHDDVSIHLDQELALTDRQNNLFAVMLVEELFECDRRQEMMGVYGTTDVAHPLVAEMTTWGKRSASGKLRVITLPHHHDFTSLRLVPTDVRERLKALKRRNVVAFQTRNPLHRAHEEITKRAVDSLDGTLLLHPAVGMTKPGDIDHFTRVRSYVSLARNHYDQDRTLLALLPLAMRMAGPREALWHALVRRNYGANHLIVGRDHASPGVDSNGHPFYPPTAAQELVELYTAETGVHAVAFDELVYLPSEQRYEERVRLRPGTAMITVSGSELRSFISRNESVPSWFMRPDVSAILTAAHPSRSQQGFCVWFTGLSGAGKSTTAEIVAVRLLESGRRVTLLDGDVVRTHLSKGLDFTRAGRDTNVRRIAFVASEIVRHGGAVLCAAVSPYSDTRSECRLMVGPDNFIEVFVDTPLEVCEARDTKGIYAQARRGTIQNFTGISDPYEPPVTPDIHLETVSTSAEANSEIVVRFLIERGFLPRP